jgi:hypothetical protein
LESVTVLRLGCDDYTPGNGFREMRAPRWVSSRLSFVYEQYNLSEPGIRAVDVEREIFHLVGNEQADLAAEILAMALT